MICVLDAPDCGVQGLVAAFCDRLGALHLRLVRLEPLPVASKAEYVEEFQAVNASASIPEDLDHYPASASRTPAI